jgi:hypothetical protein
MSKGFNVDARHRAITDEKVTIGEVEYRRRLRTVDLDAAYRAKSLEIERLSAAEHELLAADTPDPKKIAAASAATRLAQFERVALCLQGPKETDADPKVLQGRIDTLILPELEDYLNRVEPDPS